VNVMLDGNDAQQAVAEQALGQHPGAFARKMRLHFGHRFTSSNRSCFSLLSGSPSKSVLLSVPLLLSYGPAVRTGPRQFDTDNPPGILLGEAFTTMSAMTGLGTTFPAWFSSRLLAFIGIFEDGVEEPKGPSEAVRAW